MARDLKSRLKRLKELGLRPAAELPDRGPPASGMPEPASGAAGGEVEPALSDPEGTLGGIYRKPKPSEGRRESPGAIPPGAPRGTRPERPAFLAGWERLDEFLWRRELRKSLAFPDSLPLAPFVSPAKARRALRGSPLTGTRIAEAPAFPPPGEPEARIASSELLLLDFETTGLSGGTGTVAFLAAFGRLEDGGLLVEQLFLADYPGEPAFVEACLGRLAPEPAVLSYNGLRFDLPLLRTRCVMNGVRPPEPRQLDLLYPARRLFGRPAGGASLGLLEGRVLGREREEDLPGSEIPEAYLAYLRAGDHPALGAVMSHNAEDLVSLALLAARVGRLWDRGGDGAGSELDRGGLGAALLAAGRAEEGRALLAEAAADGDCRAALALCREYARAAARGGDADLKAWAEATERLAEDWRGLLERARYAERGARDRPAARDWVARALAAAPAGKVREALERRLRRLERGSGPMA